MFLRLLLVTIILMTATACATIFMAPVHKAVHDSREAVALLSYKDRTCSAFHVGGGEFITAAHCFGKDLPATAGPIELLDSKGKKHWPALVRLDAKSDLALLHAASFNGKALALWDNFWDGGLQPGMELVSVGYPGYYDADLQFEQGYVKDVVLYDGTEMIVSEETAYSGESGGPVISTSNGKVIGVVHATVERIAWATFPKHTHVSLSLFISITEVRKFLSA